VFGHAFLPGYRAGVPPANKGKKYPAEILTPAEVYALMSACSNGAAGVRERALIAIMWRAGLRIAEALALYPKDVEQQLGAIVVLHGKKDRRRTVGVDPQAFAVLERWQARRRELGISNRRHLFCTITQPTPGEPLKASCVRETFKLLAARAAIDKRVHPHGLRHTHAAELAIEGVPAHVIRRQLGHASLDTTVRYIDHLSPLDVIEAIRTRSWPDGDHIAITSSPQPSGGSGANVMRPRPRSSSSIPGSAAPSSSASP
jgi:site-specific recombinase XerD